jgi:O-antigen/teichoic acid export membrane protein
MFVNSIIASIGLLNMGLGDATIKFVSKYRSLEDPINLNRIVNAVFSLSLVFLIIFIVFGNGFAYILKSYNFFTLDKDELVITFSTIQLGSIVFGFKQVEQVLLSVFKGFEKYDTSAKLSIVSKSMLILSQVTAVYLGYFLVEIFLVSAIVSFLVVVGELLFIKSRFKQMSFIPSIKKYSIKEIFGFSSWSWIQSVLGVIAGHVDRLVVMTLAGPTFLAYYALASTVGSQVHSVLVASVSWVFPKVSGKTERNEDVNQLYYKMQLIIVVLGFVVFGILLVFENIIFKTWLGTETYNNSILLIKIFLYLALFNSLSIIPYYFMLGSNLIKFSTIFMFISLILTIGFMFLGYQFWSTVGLAYGKLLSSMLSIPIVLIFIHYKILGKTKFNSGYIIYIPVILFSISIYLLNIFSIPLFICSFLLIGYIYKTIFSTTAVKL